MTMTTPTIDALAHHAARLSRRRTFLTLGGAVFAATPAANVEPVSAGKNKNNKKKNRGRGNGGDCKKREQQRCSADAAACKGTVQPLCNDLSAAECIAIRACCDECSAEGFLTCFVTVSQA
jgi:hypothetical protein